MKRTVLRLSSRALSVGTCTALVCAVLSFAGASAAASAAAAVPACTGDCGAGGSVSVADVITLVNIALGNAQPSSCLQGIASGAAVDIAMIVEAVKNALSGCPNPAEQCLMASGDAAAACVNQYALAIGACRHTADAACEAKLRATDGELATMLAATEEPVRMNCTEEAADTLTFQLGVDDLVARTAQSCLRYGDDLLNITYAQDLSALSPAALTCQHAVGVQSAGLYDVVVQAYGEGCYVAEFDGRPCDRTRRDQRVAHGRATAAAAIEQLCGPLFDTLGLVPATASATLTGRVDALMDLVVSRARELAQRVYPPFNLGPTALFGPYPVGVHDLHLYDSTRQDATGNGWPIAVSMYYPSTPEAVSGVSRDTSLFAKPTYRDVDLAPGRFPLVLFSPGSGAAPFDYTFFAAQLASHGFIVASLYHYGDQGSELDAAANRPRDLSVVIDQLLGSDSESIHFFVGAVDATRIGAAGHSAGGYTAMALAMCPFELGNFTDPRVTAVFAIDPGALTFLSFESPSSFSAITTPMILVGGTLSWLAQAQPVVYGALEPGPVVMDFANLTDAIHTTFDDNCEIPDAIAIATGGLFPECEPGVLPWRYARYITDYLALNFFDATLNGNAEALARLNPAALTAKVEDMTYQSKAGICPAGQSCSLTCAETKCGDGIVGPGEVCDPPGEQGQCAAGQLCNSNCTACVDCSGATVIPPDGGVIDGTTVGGTSVLGSSCGLDIIAPERVFQWTPSVSHDATIQTCGGSTDFDTTLYVRADTCQGPDLACNDDGPDPCGPHSMLTLSVVAGTTYYIVVDGNGTGSGTFTLSVE
jgi:predicted dienelactone hydrolase